MKATEKETLKVYIFNIKYLTFEKRIKFEN